MTGALSVLFGILVIMNPAAGSRSVVYLIAGWALVTGTLKVIFAFKVKNLPERASDIKTNPSNTPITYMLDGRQYLVFAADDTLYAYALPR